MIVTRFAWIAQRFLNRFRLITLISTRVLEALGEGALKLTRLRINARGMLLQLLGGRGWPSFATVIRLLCSRSLVWSCPVRLVEPIRNESRRTRENSDLRTSLWLEGRTSRENGSFRMRRSVLRWYFLISRRATVPGLNLFFFLGLAM